MGNRTKSLIFIFCDYAICGLLGVAYFQISRIHPHPQCIPQLESDDTNRNVESCYHDDNEFNAMNTTTGWLAFPHIEKQQVPYTWPYILGCAHWAGVLILSVISIRPTLHQLQRIVLNMECLFREVLTAVLVSQLIVIGVKVFVGRARPKYYQYRSHNLEDSISSFPSGHASASFCIHTLLILHVLASMVWSYGHAVKHHDGQGADSWAADNIHSLFGTWFWSKMRHCASLKMICVVALLVVPFWISCTRITDYYHHYSDVVAGACIGTLVSTIAFTVYHNELYSIRRFRNKESSERLLSCNFSNSEDQRIFRE